MSSTAPIILRRTLRGLEPDNDLSRQALGKLRMGQAVRVEIKRPRSLPWLRRYWAMVNLISENTSYAPDEVHLLLKLRCGCAKPIHERGRREPTWVPDSIAFDKMTADQWADYWNRVTAYVCEILLPGVTEAQLEQELRDLVGLPPTAAGAA